LHALVGSAARPIDELEASLTLPTHPARARISDDGKSVATWGLEGLSTWSATDGKSLPNVDAKLAVQPPTDGRLEAQSLDGTWHTRVPVRAAVAERRRSEPNPATHLLRHGAPISLVRIDRAGRTALTASFDGFIRLWDVETGLERAVLEAPGAPIDAHLD